jgi:hypothetical protein
MTTNGCLRSQRGSLLKRTPRVESRLFFGLPSAAVRQVGVKAGPCCLSAASSADCKCRVQLQFDHHVTSGLQRIEEAEFSSLRRSWKLKVSINVYDLEKLLESWHPVASHRVVIRSRSQCSLFLCRPATNENRIWHMLFVGHCEQNE